MPFAAGQKLRASQLPQYVGKQVATSDGPSGITTTETLDPGTDLTFSYNDTLRYQVWWQGPVVGTDGGIGQYFTLRLRIASGTSVTASGTFLHGMNFTTEIGGDWKPEQLLAEFSADELGGIISSGTVTIGVFMVRTGGSGSYDFRGGSTNRRVLVLTTLGPL